MKKIAFIIIIAFCFIAWGFSFKTNQKRAVKKPNIVLIMADDMGFSDIGYYGSEIKTPNLDKLASEGMRLKQCYNNAICAPSRATLLTGQYPHKAVLLGIIKILKLPNVPLSIDIKIALKIHIFKAI